MRYQGHRGPSKWGKYKVNSLQKSGALLWKPNNGALTTMTPTERTPNVWGQPIGRRSMGEAVAYKMAGPGMLLPARTSAICVTEIATLKL